MLRNKAIPAPELYIHLEWILRGWMDSEKTKKMKIVSASVRLFLLAVFMGISSLADAQNPPVVYISRDSTGDYQCDGDADQVEINQALQFVATHQDYTTVYLKGPFEYVVNEPVLIPSHTILAGDPDALIRLQDSVDWQTRYKPVITQSGLSSWDAYGNPGETVEDVEIYGFGIDGGEQIEGAGQGYYTLIHLSNASRIKIHDLSIIHGQNDAIRISSDTSQVYGQVEVYNNRIHASGHDGISFVNLLHAYAHHNRITKTRTNSGIRANHCDSVYIHHNVIGNSLTRSASGFAGIQIQNATESAPFTDGEIAYNVIYGKAEGIHLGDQSGSPVYPTGTMRNMRIRYNRIYKTREVNSGVGVLSGGIVIMGFQHTLIENNVIDGNTGDGIVYKGNAGGGSGYETYVHNNIIIHGESYGIHNDNTTDHRFVASYNLVYQNQSGNYENVTPEYDVNEDPLFGGTRSTFHHWYHIVAVFDSISGRMKIYVNGTLKAERTLPAGFGQIAVNDDNIIAGDYYNYYHYAGLMDGLGFWNRALDEQEIQMLYNNGSPGAIQGSLLNGLYAWYRMENNWNDDSGNGKNALSASAGFSTHAIEGDYAGAFDGTDDRVVFPDDMTYDTGLSISVWVYRENPDPALQNIVHKGNQSHNDHFWLYFKDESIYFEIGNGQERKSLESFVLAPEELDYHVQSAYGRYDNGNWVTDSLTSPCVDAGNPQSPYELEPEPNGQRINIGLYGNTPEASKSQQLGIKTARGNILRVYPNPASEFLFLTPSPEGSPYRIYDMSGQCVQDGIFYHSLNIRKLLPGIYLLELYGEKETSARRLLFIKE